MATFTRSGLFTPFTPVFNANGQPAISLPLYQGADGLPLGVQIVGRPVGEAELLGLATQLEVARPGPSGVRRFPRSSRLHHAQPGSRRSYYRNVACLARRCARECSRSDAQAR